MAKSCKKVQKMFKCQKMQKIAKYYIINVAQAFQSNNTSAKKTKVEKNVKMRKRVKDI